MQCNHSLTYRRDRYSEGSPEPKAPASLLVKEQKFLDRVEAEIVKVDEYRKKLVDSRADAAHNVAYLTSAIARQHGIEERDVRKMVELMIPQL